MPLGVDLEGVVLVVEPKQTALYTIRERKEDRDPAREAAVTALPARRSAGEQLDLGLSEDLEAGDRVADTCVDRGLGTILVSKQNRRSRQCHVVSHVDKP